ncbi:hypothetical protein [Pseudoalteromonas phenolica]|uniref:hypothetical protein n=1 Tax=Pseudoalteromonas phenolica TaxID=161398 RepID=UPI00110AA230|nr:hypothetical protein [Pseudoalteromonas phenolica]TMO55767.1 hypothetical protein CWC21_09995 [Pseudoalteromonas phenolica]
MKKLTLISILFIALYFANTAMAKQISVIVNANNATNTLTKKQLIDLYMGRYVAFPNNQSAQPLDTLATNELKSIFYKRLVNMPLSRVNAYWSRVRFTGRAKPPLELRDQQVIIAFVENNPNAIGYVYSDALTKPIAQKVKVVMELYE